MEEILCNKDITALDPHFVEKASKILCLSKRLEEVRELFYNKKIEPIKIALKLNLKINTINKYLSQIKNKIKETAPFKEGVTYYIEKELLSDILEDCIKNGKNKIVIDRINEILQKYEDLFIFTISKSCNIPNFPYQEITSFRQDKFSKYLIESYFLTKSELRNRKIDEILDSNG